MRHDLGDVEGEPTKKRVLAKVMWYFPMILCLKHLFINKDDTKFMQLHKEEHKEDGMLRLPTNGSQWRKFDKTFPD